MSQIQFKYNPLKLCELQWRNYDCGSVARSAVPTPPRALPTSPFFSQQNITEF